MRHYWARFEGYDRAGLRRLGRDIRAHAVANLPELVGRFADTCEAAGTHVHFAADATEANRIVTGICRRAEVKLAVKSKSMLSEEIDLNPALEQRRRSTWSRPTSANTSCSSTATGRAT